MSRVELELAYRKYFSVIRKFEPFPLTISFENAIDFAAWLLLQEQTYVRKTL